MIVPWASGGSNFRYPILNNWRLGSKLLNLYVFWMRLNLLSCLALLLDTQLNFHLQWGRLELGIISMDACQPRFPSVWLCVLLIFFACNKNKIVCPFLELFWNLSASQLNSFDGPLFQRSIGSFFLNIWNPYIAVFPLWLGQQWCQLGTNVTVHIQFVWPCSALWL